MKWSSSNGNILHLVFICKEVSALLEENGNTYKPVGIYVCWTYKQAVTDTIYKEYYI